MSDFSLSVSPVFVVSMLLIYLDLLKNIYLIYHLHPADYQTWCSMSTVCTGCWLKINKYDDDGHHYLFVFVNSLSGMFGFAHPYASHMINRTNSINRKIFNQFLNSTGKINKTENYLTTRQNKRRNGVIGRSYGHLTIAIDNIFFYESFRNNIKNYLLNYTHSISYNLDKRIFFNE